MTTAAAVDTRHPSIAAETSTGPTGTATVSLLWDSELQKWIARFTQTEGSRMEVSEEGDVTVHWKDEDTTARLVLELKEEWRFVGFLVGWDGETGIPVGTAAEVRYSASLATSAAQRIVVDLEKPEGEPVFGYMFIPGLASGSEGFVADASSERILIDPKITNKGDG
jgi:hypothetical protein